MEREKDRERVPVRGQEKVRARVRVKEVEKAPVRVMAKVEKVKVKGAKAPATVQEMENPVMEKKVKKAVKKAHAKNVPIKPRKNEIRLLKTWIRAIRKKRWKRLRNPLRL
jgi:hypothetical protein